MSIFDLELYKTLLYKSFTTIFSESGVVIPQTTYYRNLFSHKPKSCVNHNSFKVDLMACSFRIRYFGKLCDVFPFNLCQCLSQFFIVIAKCQRLFWEIKFINNIIYLLWWRYSWLYHLMPNGARSMGKEVKRKTPKERKTYRKRRKSQSSHNPSSNDYHTLILFNLKPKSKCTNPSEIHSKCSKAVFS